MNRKNLNKKENDVISKDRASELRVGIVVAEFNADITKKLLEGAKKTLQLHGVQTTSIEDVWVPGGFEIPLACQELACSRREYDALIAIGCVIRGDTDHYVYIANESNRGTMDVMLKYSIPIANCILTVNNLEQAQDRCGEDNKGSEAALAALAMVS